MTNRFIESKVSSSSFRPFHAHATYTFTHDTQREPRISKPWADVLISCVRLSFQTWKDKRSSEQIPRSVLRFDPRKREEPSFHHLNFHRTRKKIYRRRKALLSQTKNFIYCRSQDSLAVQQNLKKAEITGRSEILQKQDITHV